LIDYNALNALLEANEVPGVLKGRIVIQLSTGTPKDARTVFFTYYGSILQKRH
jgi:hypothetical protein